MQSVLWVAGGAVFGYGWHRLIGCRSGSCALMSNPWIATGYGAALGFVTATMP